MTASTMPTPLRLEGKALTTTTLASGDLRVSGWAAYFVGLDAQSENFTPGAFAATTRRFIESGGPLCWNHDKGAVLGQVVSLEERKNADGHGLWLEAVVRFQPVGSKLRGAYEAIKSRTATGLSCGGYFARAWRAGRQMIVAVELTEISAAARPSHPSARLSNVVEVKSLDGITGGLDRAMADFGRALDAYEMRTLRDRVARMADEDHARWVRDMERCLA